jgi:hypothetical protein
MGNAIVIGSRWCDQVSSLLVRSPNDEGEMMDNAIVVVGATGHLQEGGQRGDGTTAVIIIGMAAQR